MVVARLGDLLLIFCLMLKKGCPVNSPSDRQGPQWGNTRTRRDTRRPSTSACIATTLRSSYLVHLRLYLFADASELRLSTEAGRKGNQGLTLGPHDASRASAWTNKQRTRRPPLSSPSPSLLISQDTHIHSLVHTPLSRDSTYYCVITRQHPQTPRTSPKRHPRAR